MSLKIYGADWCVDCVNTKNFLDDQKIKYDYIDIINNKHAISIIEKINNGKRIIPTLIFNGITYSNPDLKTLNEIIKQIN